ncbi:MAG TPA: histidine--tRNA ligase [Syntrophorhabdaceae bacterium]|nr:histidine--tRNA ligase [Syntrophorhabdaceae bacterium]HPU29023.1 histidine--tRNA ligase [Syntrophorhabdaceae bacterium]
MEKIKTLRGFRDIYGEEVEKLRLIETTSRKYFELFGYREIIIPVLENTGLFIRSIGDTTDIVEKEMFTFKDLSGESVTLRPEATAGIVRAYLETGMFAKERVSKLFSIGPMFRHERPQKGRYREFRQIDVEVFGIDDPMIDAELIWMTSFILKEIGLEKYAIEVNSVGCPVCRTNFKNIIVDYFEAKEENLCDDCKRRLRKNPLRIFDCKNKQCKEIGAASPVLFDNLCDSCKIHFYGFLEYLNTLKLNVSINKRLVRGLDYYTRTVFEFISNELGAQNAFLAGGRYNNLVEAMGGPNVPGIGFAIGMERLAMLIDKTVKKATPQFFFAYLGDRAKAFIIPFMERFIEKNLKLSYLPQAKSLKSQMRYADAIKADYVLILGDDEIEKNIIVVRDMAKGNQFNIPLDNLALIQNLSAFLEK